MTPARPQVAWSLTVTTCTQIVTTWQWTRRLSLLCGISTGLQTTRPILPALPSSPASESAPCPLARCHSSLSAMSHGTHSSCSRRPLPRHATRRTATSHSSRQHRRRRRRHRRRHRRHRHPSHHLGPVRRRRRRRRHCHPRRGSWLIAARVHGNVYHCSFAAPYVASVWGASTWRRCASRKVWHRTGASAAAASPRVTPAMRIMSSSSLIEHHSASQPHTRASSMRVCALLAHLLMPTAHLQHRCPRRRRRCALVVWPTHPPRTSQLYGPHRAICHNLGSLAHRRPIRYFPAINMD
jgi:hypothetical protein